MSPPPGPAAKGAALEATGRPPGRRARLAADLPRTVRLLERRAGLSPYFRTHPRPHEDPGREARRFARWTRRAARDGLAAPALPDLAAVEAAWADLRARKPRRPGISAFPRRAPNLRLLRLGHDPSRHFAGRRGAWPRRESWAALHLSASGRIQAHRLDRHDWEVLRLADGHHQERTIVDRVAESCDVWNREVQRSIRELRREGLLAPDR